MLLRILLSIGLFLVMGLPTAQAARLVSPDQWVPLPGDALYVDVSQNWGYLLHKDSSQVLAFPVASGQQNYIRYLGMTYYAGTPLETWTAKSAHTKSDRVTFGPTGLFLRLYKDGTEYTRYGIHGHADSAEWLAQENRYRSAGCIVTSEGMMSIIKQTFDTNGGMLTVITTNSQGFILQELALRVSREIARQI